MPRLPGLDGLRAVAVLGVVLYHLGVPWLPGGLLGVDVFFVLSGFLITTLVVEEIERTGRVNLRAFYLSRARRLLPGLFLVLAAVSLLSVLALPEERAELRRDVVAAMMYVSNWSYVLNEQSYFESVGRPPMLQHLWSLAVEEQFYLLWPAVVAGAMVVGRHRLRRVAALAAVISATWMALLAAHQGYPLTNDPSRAYFGTDTHAMGLLLGAALATFWSPWRIWRPDRSWLTSERPTGQRLGTALVDLVGVAALAGIVWTFFAVGEFSPLLYRGGFFAVAGCSALLVASLAHPAGLLGRVLAVQPVRYLGERSYGIYLWHWPLALVTRPGFELPFGGWFSVLVRLAIIVGAAELSYRYVEQPIRAGALGELIRKLRSLSSYPVEARAKVLAAATALTLGVAPIGVVVLAAPASSGSPGEQAGLVQPKPELPPEAATAHRRPVSVFGDSVAYGASYQLWTAGASVSAAEGRRFGEVLTLIAAANRRGTLGRTVVLHAGNNGPVDEDALTHALDDLAQHRVYLVNLHVPRSWETYNNHVFERVAARYSNVTLLDWHAEASSHDGWLYPDQTHLTAESGREGYADWLLSHIRPRLSPSPERDRRTD